MARWKSQALAAGLAAGLVLGGCDLGDEASRPPQLGARSGDEDATSQLGFPVRATKNTVRVGGADAAADAAGVASALFPATSNGTRPDAVVLVEGGDWQSGIAAGVLAGDPIGAPILLTDGDELPPVSEDTLERLRPRGARLARGAQVIRIGSGTARPGDLKTAVIEGASPYERAARIDRFFAAARGKASANVVVASGEQAEWAMPAAAWAAFSGDAVLFTERDSLPAATRRALEQHDDPNVYVLGPESVISRGVERQLEGVAREVHRIEGRDPVRNAIAFARYERGNFGWAIRQPGYSFTIANSSRPLDAAAAASLTATGVPSVLLLNDSASRLAEPLAFYLLNLQPGFERDARDVAFSRIWLLGDESALSVAAQAQLDQLSQLIPVRVDEP